MALFGERVKVKDSYEYLGTTTPNADIDWKQHLEKVMKAAESRSNDLLWVCRYDSGMRPRTAVSLWQAMVRPMLEYASEVWACQISETLAAEAEALQMRFLRGTLGLHTKGKGGVSDDAVRAETGCEPLRQRWAKLKLGYWRRIFASPPDRLLRVVAKFRHDENVASGGHGLGGRGFMNTVKAALIDHGLQEYWDDPLLANTVSAGMWKKITYDAVEEAGDGARHNRMLQLSSTADYAHIKDWGRNTPEYAVFSSEVDRLGRNVPERYLDDRQDLKGTRLKLLCRLGSLPVMARVDREARPPCPREQRVCHMCNSPGTVEDVRRTAHSAPAYTPEVLECPSAPY